MKRKGSDFVGFFSNVTAAQQVIDLGDSWVIDFQIQQVAQPLIQRIAGRDVASLWPGYRWLYWVPKAGESTCLIFLNAEGHPVWCYADVIAGAGLDERGYPWTDDLYLDVVAICEVKEGRWWAGDAEIIDRDDLAQALASAEVAPEEARRAEAVALQVQAALEGGTYFPLQRLEALCRQTGEPSLVKADQGRIRHTPAPIPAASVRTSQERQAQARPQTSAQCRTCQSGHLTVQYGKYGYYLKCGDCGGNTPAKPVCAQAASQPASAKVASSLPPPAQAVTAGPTGPTRPEAQAGYVKAKGTSVLHGGPPFYRWPSESGR